MVGPAAKPAEVAHLQAVMGLSERRACSIVDRKMVRYRPSRPAAAVLRGRLRDLATSRGASAIAACSSCCGGRGAIGNHDGCILVKPAWRWGADYNLQHPRSSVMASVAPTMRLTSSRNS